MNLHFSLPGLRRVTLFIGAYGSGKSEISLNFAFWLRSQNKKVTLVDLDIINPYYRTVDARITAEAKSIRVIAPPFAGTNVDVPAVPPDINSIFDDPSRHAVLDIGGEDMGARVVSMLKMHLRQMTSSFALYMVVNPYRPFNETADQVEKTAQSLSSATGLELTGLVHNANLLEAGGASLLSDSWFVVKQAADRLALPVVFAAAMHETIPPSWGDKTPEGIPLLRLDRKIRYPG
jgi:hypothetical protein